MNYIECPDCEGDILIIEDREYSCENCQIKTEEFKIELNQEIWN